MGRLDFIQLNMHRAEIANAELLVKLASLKHPYICCLQEPYTTRNKLASKPKDALCFPSNTQGSRPRSAIFVRKDVAATELVQFCNQDITAVQTLIKSVPTVIVSLYMDITLASVVPAGVIDIIGYCKSKRLALLIAADTNCHSELFGPDTNRRGVVLEEFIVTHGLGIENVGMVPTFASSRSQSCIDATFTLNFPSKITDWRVLTDFNGSDHRTITYHTQNCWEKVPSKWLWDKANWPLFTSTLEKFDFSIPSVMNDKKLDRLVSRFYSAVNKALEASCPTTKESFRDSDNKWYTQSLDKFRQKVIKLHRSTSAGGTSREKKKFQRLQKTYRREVRRRKRRSWNEFKRSRETPKDMASFTKILESNVPQRISTFKLSNGTYTNPGKETAEHLLMAHFPSATDIKPIRHKYENKLLATEIMLSCSDWISPSLVMQSLCKFKSKKSPGPDGLRPMVLPHLSNNAVDALTFIYKSCICLSYTPLKWREANVVFIPKLGKPSYDNPKSFRPISLSNYLLKGLERLAVWRMDIKISTNPVHTRQHGFRSDRSTETAISELTDYIEMHLLKKRQCLGVFLDIKGAFDNIKPTAIYDSLLAFGADRNLADWYLDYLQQRNLFFTLDGHTVAKSIGIGFPQGGVASAKFWLYAFDGAVSIINSSDIKGTAFADDCAALYGGTNLGHMIRNIQQMLNRLVTWGRSRGLEFNSEKTVVVLFSRKKIEPPFMLDIEGSDIPYSSTVKYLGVTVDSKLNWQAHLRQKATKAKQLLALLLRATISNWGPRPYLMKWAYTGMVRPMFSYAAVAWSHTITTKRQKKILEQIDRLALLAITQTAPSVPTKGLAAIYDVMPLLDYLKQSSIACYARLPNSFEMTWDGKGHTLHYGKAHRLIWRELACDWELPNPT